MRVTQQALVSQIISNIQARFSKIADVQNQLSTGSKIQYASDDPAAASEILELNSNLRQSVQFRRNIDRGLGLLGATESGVGQIGDIMISVRSDALRGANGGLSDADRETIAVTVDQKLREVINLLNQKHVGYYLFSGGNANTAPFRIIENEDGMVVRVQEQVEEDIQPIVQIVDENHRMEFTIAGDDFLDLGEGDTLADIMIDLRETLMDGTEEEVGNLLERLDVAIDQLSGWRGILGARVATANSFKEKLITSETHYTNRVSDLRDVDVVTAISEFQLEQNALEVALRASASVVQPSLVNFIKF